MPTPSLCRAPVLFAFRRVRRCAPWFAWAAPLVSSSIAARNRNDRRAAFAAEHLACNQFHHLAALHSDSARDHHIWMSDCHPSTALYARHFDAQSSEAQHPPSLDADAVPHRMRGCLARRLGCPTRRLGCPTRRLGCPTRRLGCTPLPSTRTPLPSTPSSSKHHPPKYHPRLTILDIQSSTHDPHARHSRTHRTLREPPLARSLALLPRCEHILLGHEHCALSRLLSHHLSSCLHHLRDTCLHLRALSPSEQRMVVVLFVLSSR
jgi:hypothetical protein